MFSFCVCVCDFHLILKLELNASFKETLIVGFFVVLSPLSSWSTCYMPGTGWSRQGSEEGDDELGRCTAAF